MLLYVVMVWLASQVGVFVSIVSTKIPFKGAGKEYIGDDVEEMVGAVKQAIQNCGVQLKVRAAGEGGGGLLPAG
jgi:DNA topoisomerase VI subunit B